MVATTARVKAAPAHEHGTCRWSVPLQSTSPLAREEELEIYNARATRPHWQAYGVVEWSDLDGPTGYSLAYLDRRDGEARTYDLPADLTSCGCAAGAFRGGSPCKHARALSTLLRIAVEGVISAPAYSDPVPGMEAGPWS